MFPLPKTGYGSPIRAEGPVRPNLPDFTILTVLDDLYKSQSFWLRHSMTIRFDVMPTVPKHIKHLLSAAFPCSFNVLFPIAQILLWRPSMGEKFQTPLTSHSLHNFHPLIFLSHLCRYGL